MLKRFFIFFIITVHCSLFTVLCFSQDRPAANPPLLPFQTTPNDNNDEQIGMQFFQNKEFDKAADVFERLYAQKPLPYIYTYYLFSLVEIQEYAKAEKLVKAVQKDDPDALKYLVDLGYIAFRKGDPDKEKKLYEESLKKLPANQQQIFDLANAFILRNENEYAARVYLKGRQLMNNSYPFSFELAMIYERTGEFRKVMDEYFNLLENNRSYLNTIEDRLQFDLSNDPDNSKNEFFRKYLLELSQKDPDKTYYAEMLWWYSIQQKDFELALIQAKALDRRMREDGGRVYQLAGMAASNMEYPSAIDGYKYLVSKGKDFPYYELSRTALLNTRFTALVAHPNPDRKELTGLEAEFTAEIKATDNRSQLVVLVKNLAHLEAFYLGKDENAIEILSQVVERPDLDPKLKSDCKLELGDIYLFTGNEWEATLCYQQVYMDFKNDAVGENAKFKNAKLAYYFGEFKWAQAQLDILKAATTKLVANDAMALSLLISEHFDPDSNTVALGYYSRADLLEYRNRDEEALKTLDSIPLAFKDHTIFPDMYFAKANILVKEGKYQEADTLLGTIVSLYSEDVISDEALMLRARMNEEQINDKARAMNFYDVLMSKYPGSIYIPEARKRFRALRGDKAL